MKRWSSILAVVALLSTQTLQAKVFKAERWQTANGATVVFYQAMEVPMLDIDIAFAAGSAYDGKNFGLAALTTELLAQGSGSLDASQIAERFADVGAQYEANTSRDMAVLQLKTLSSDEALGQALNTLSQVMGRPAFRQDAFNHEKNQQLVAINKTQQSPDDLANMVFFNKLYQQHPYAHPINGTMESVNKLTLAQVREFYKNYFTSSNVVIVMVGAIDSGKAHQIAELLTQNLPKGHAATPIPKALPSAAEETISVRYPASQTMIRIGQIGIDHQVPDYYPLMVGNYILGGGTLTSRLTHEVREKRGLSYSVQSQFMPMWGNGPFIISLSTRNKQAANAMKVTEDTLNSFLSDGPSEAELQAAKQYLIGSFPLSLASNNAIAGVLLRMAFYHLPDDYLDTYTARIENVTAEDVKKAFEQRLHPNKMLRVSVGPTPSDKTKKAG